MVESIRYTQSLLSTEKPHVINIAIAELLTAMHHNNDSRTLEAILSKYIIPIQDFANNLIDYHTALQQLQPLETVPNQYDQDIISEYNSVAHIINALTYQPRHEAILRQLCNRLIEMSHRYSPEPIIEYL
jgi:F0F1-type ATP synthase gamma subunit